MKNEAEDMKKVFIILVALGLVFFGVYYFSNKENNVVKETTSTEKNRILNKINTILATSKYSNMKLGKVLKHLAGDGGDGYIIYGVQASDKYDVEYKLFIDSNKKIYENDNFPELDETNYENTALIDNIYYDYVNDNYVFSILPEDESVYAEIMDAEGAVNIVAEVPATAKLNVNDKKMSVQEFVEKYDVNAEYKYIPKKLKIIERRK